MDPGGTAGAADGARSTRTSAAAARRPRVVDVASLAGVSAQTVSNVINNRGGFTQATRSRVQAAIDELGFLPNRYAQSLRSRRTMLLGFDLSSADLDPMNPFTTELLRALVDRAGWHGYRVVMFAHAEGQPTDLEATAAAGEVDGFILSNSPPDDPRQRALAGVGVPFMVMGRTAPDLPQNWVDIDNKRAIGAAVDHLVDEGHRTFGYLGRSADFYWELDRLEGTKSRLKEHGLGLDPMATLMVGSEHAHALIRRMLSGPGRPEAIVTSSDSLAILAVNVATSLGLRVGQDLAITGFDAGALSALSEPPLTSVRIPVEQAATVLVEHLIAQIKGTAAEQGVLVETTLVRGRSA